MFDHSLQLIRLFQNAVSLLRFLFWLPVWATLLQVIFLLIVRFLYRINSGMCFYTESVCMFFYLFQFFFGKPTGIYDHAVNLIAFFFCKIFYTVRSIQAAAKTQYYFIAFY